MNPGRLQLQTQLRQFASQNLRLIMIRAPMVIFGGEQANHLAWPEAAGAPCTLLCGRFADPFDFEGRQAGPGRIGGDSGQTGIHHRAYALNGDGTFGKIRRENYLAPGGRCHREILLCGRHIAIERGQQRVVLLGPAGTGPHGAPDFRCAGQEHQDVAIPA